MTPLGTPIRVKALGLHWRGNALLASEVREADGTLKGVRPLGGHVEFGERTEETVRREFQEELGITVDVTGDPLVFENIYQYRGAPGHEIVFLYPVAFPDGAFAGQDVLHYQEDNGETCVARWFPLDTLDPPNGLALFPDGLKDRLTSNETRTPNDH